MVPESKKKSEVAHSKDFCNYCAIISDENLSFCEELCRESLSQNGR